MRSKYSTLANSCFLFLLIASSALAQAPSPTAAKSGGLRFWDMLPPGNGSFEVRKAGAPESEQNLLSGSAYEYSSYVEFVGEKYQLAVFKKGDRKNPLKLINIDLKPDTFFTIIVSPKGGVVTVEVFDDTTDPKATAGTLTIRNYFSGSTVAVTSVNQNWLTPFHMGKAKRLPVFPWNEWRLPSAQKLPNGTVAESGAEADFKASSRATVLVIPDSYGRFRPRVTIDGKNR